MKQEFVKKNVDYRELVSLLGEEFTNTTKMPLHNSNGVDKDSDIPIQVKDLTKEQVSEYTKAFIGLTAARTKPRDMKKVKVKIAEQCSNIAFVSEAFYALQRYSKQKGKNVDLDGPSIRMAEMLAIAWTNMDISIKEISRKKETIKMQTSAYDMESNVRWSVETDIDVKDLGGTDTKRQNSLYERVMSVASKCIRRCILGAIPHSVQHYATQVCNKTENKHRDESVTQREVVEKVIESFQRYGVRSQQILEYLGIDTFDELNQGGLMQLRKIMRAIIEEGQDIQDWFGNTKIGQPIEIGMTKPEEQK